MDKSIQWCQRHKCSITCWIGFINFVLNLRDSCVFCKWNKLKQTNEKIQVFSVKKMLRKICNNLIRVIEITCIWKQYCVIFDPSMLVADRNVRFVVLLASHKWSGTIDNWIKSYTKLCHYSERSESGNSLVCAAN